MGRRTCQGGHVRVLALPAPHGCAEPWAVYVLGGLGHPECVCLAVSPLNEVQRTGRRQQKAVSESRVLTMSFPALGVWLRVCPFVSDLRDGDAGGQWGVSKRTNDL